MSTVGNMLIFGTLMVATAVMFVVFIVLSLVAIHSVFGETMFLVLLGCMTVLALGWGLFTGYIRVGRR